MESACQVFDILPLKEKENKLFQFIVRDESLYKNTNEDDLTSNKLMEGINQKNKTNLIEE